MSGLFHIWPVSVGLDSQIWYLFICITRYLNVRRISEAMGFRTFVGPLVRTKKIVNNLHQYMGSKMVVLNLMCQKLWNSSISKVFLGSSERNYVFKGSKVRTTKIQGMCGREKNGSWQSKAWFLSIFTPCIVFPQFPFRNPYSPVGFKTFTT